MSSEVTQRKRSPSPTGVRSLSPEQIERKTNAEKGMRKRNQKQSDFFDKYAYHLVIGGFVLLCLLAFGSTLFKSSKKLSTIPVIDEDEIQSHNSQGYSYTLGSNEAFVNWMLSDAKYILNNHLTFKSSLGPCSTNQESTIIPGKYNFREEYPHCAQPVYFQGNCSSSYAIAATSAVSDRICKNRGGVFLDQLSPQSPLSCDKQKNFGCNGGSVSRVFDYAKKHGLVTRQCMEFQGNDESKECEDLFKTCEKHKIIDYCVSSKEESIKREIYKNGPVVTVLPVYKDFLIYRDGVYQVVEGTSRFQQGHAVKLIGWDRNEHGQDYWIIENSWGESWGQKGFGYIGVGQANLLIEEYVLAPIVEEVRGSADQQPEVTIEQINKEPVVSDLE